MHRQLGGVFQISRILAVLFLPALLRRIKGSRRVVNSFITFFVFFYLYCLGSMLWTTDTTEGIKELLYYPVHFVYFLEIIVFARYAVKPLKSLSMGWVTAVSFCSIIAIWELTTGQHLSMTTTLIDSANTDFGIVDRFTAAVTFGNYNSYVTFLCYSLPWTLYQMMQKTHSIKTKSIVIFALAMSIVCILFNASRGGLLTFIVVGLIWFFKSPKNPIQKTIILSALIIGGYYLLTNYGSSILLMIEARTGDGNLTDNDSRSAIWSVAVDCLIDTFGIGTGIGSVTSALGKGNPNVIASTHSLFFEFLMQYGVIFTIVVLLFILRMFLSVKKIQEKERKLVSYMSFLSMPIYTIIDSGYLLSPHLYALFGTLFVFVYLERIRNFKSSNII